MTEIQKDNPERYGVKRVPKVGEQIYVPGGDYDQGGIAVINRVWEMGSKEKPVLEVSVKEHKASAYNWFYLEPAQDNLRERYGDQKALDLPYNHGQIVEERRAQAGKFRILGIDKNSPPGSGHWVVGDYESLEKTLQMARKLSEKAAPRTDNPSMATVYYVYDDKGTYVGGDIYKGE